MMSLRDLLLAVLLAGYAGLAVADPAQSCYEMYPEDSYSPEERSQLVQDCIDSYATQAPAEEPVSEEPAYYEGTVEDFVNQAPAEEPAVE